MKSALHFDVRASNSAIQSALTRSSPHRSPDPRDMDAGRVDWREIHSSRTIKVRILLLMFVEPSNPLSRPTSHAERSKDSSVMTALTSPLSTRTVFGYAFFASNHVHISFLLSLGFEAIPSFISYLVGNDGVAKSVPPHNASNEAVRTFTCQFAKSRIDDSKLLGLYI